MKFEIGRNSTMLVCVYLIWMAVIGMLLLVHPTIWLVMGFALGILYMLMLEFMEDSFKNGRVKGHGRRG